MGSILCSINPFLNHVFEVFLYEDLRGILKQLKTPEGVAQSEPRKKGNFCEQRIWQFVPEGILSRVENHLRISYRYDLSSPSWQSIICIP